MERDRDGRAGSVFRRMNVHLLYVGIDAIAIALMLIVAARFLHQAPKNKNAWLIALIVLGAISYILSSRQDYGALIPDPYDVDFGGFFPVLNLLRNATTAIFMLLCHSIFRDGSPAPKTLLALLAVQLFLEEPLAWMLGSAAANPTASLLLYEVLPSAIQILFLGFALYWILNERDADLVAARRTARVFLLVVYVAQVVLSLAVERVAMSFDLIPWMAQYPIHVVIVAIGLMTSLAILISLMSPDSVASVLSIDSSPVVDPSRTAASDTDTTEADVARVREALETERVYRRTGLSVGDLANHLSLPEYRLRSLIHHHLGFRNFNVLLHHYRIGEVSEALADPAQNRTPVLTLALSAGYQSLSPFNRAFRDLQGMTPTEYRPHVQKNSVESCNTTPISATEP